MSCLAMLMMLSSSKPGRSVPPVAVADATSRGDGIIAARPSDTDFFANFVTDNDPRRSKSSSID